MIFWFIYLVICGSDGFGVCRCSLCAANSHFSRPAIWHCDCDAHAILYTCSGRLYFCFAISFSCYSFGVCVRVYVIIMNLMNELRSHSVRTCYFTIHYTVWLIASQNDLFENNVSVISMFVSVLSKFLFLFFPSTVDCKLCEYSQ